MTALASTCYHDDDDYEDELVLYFCHLATISDLDLGLVYDRCVHYKCFYVRVSDRPVFQHCILLLRTVTTSVPEFCCLLAVALSTRTM